MFWWKMIFAKILQSKLDLFTIDDLKQILQTKNEQTIRNYLSRAKKKWLVENLYYWIWKIPWRKEDIFYLATKIKKKSYISFESVLKKHWVIFQYYWDDIFLASDNTWIKYYKNYKIKYFKIKDDILLNPLGIKFDLWYPIATLERAICDIIYRSKNYFFDDLSFVDFDKLQKIAKIYNKRVILEVNKLIDNA